MKAFAVAFLAAAGLAVAQPGPTHGAAAGDPRPDAASLWTRASGPALVSAIYAQDPLFGGAVETPPVLAGTSTDFTVRFDLTGLSPATTWYYRFRFADPSNPSLQALGPPGRFRTAPLPNAMADVDVAFTADIGNLGLYGLFASITAEDPDLTLLLGDFPYADSSPAATTLAAYRQKHKDARDHATLQTLLAVSAIAPIWDDHEIANDWDAATPMGLVALGRQAWKEFMPVAPQGDAVYRSLRLGQGAELFILDARSYRAVNEAPDLPGKTLLGATQRQWLMGALQASDALFKIVVTSVPLRYGTTNKDHWQGFMRERRMLLDWIAAERIPNVLFLSGDQHWSAVHHHREGFKEFQACPLAAGLRAPPAEPEPEVIAIHPVHSFGVLRIRPTASPPEVVVEIHDASGTIDTRVVTAALPGAIDVGLDDPDASFVLEGPHRFRSSGRDNRFAYAPPGAYAFTARSARRTFTLPAGSGATLPEGGHLGLAVGFGTLDDPAHPTLFRADFNAPDLAGWTAVDEGTVDGPSAWFQDDHELVQSSNLYGGSTSASVPDKPGTFFAAGDPAWTDYTFTFRVKTHDDDAIGAMFRVTQGGACYRFAMDQQRSYRRITRTLGGQTVVLAEAAAGYEVDHWYDVTIKALGPSLSVALDGETILAATDAAIPAGRIALYTWGSQVVWFDDVCVRQGDVTPGIAGALFADDFGAGSLAGWAVVDQGTVAAPSSWTATGGEAVQSSNIYGGSLDGSDPVKPGTFLLAGDPAWTDVFATVRLRNDDNDGIGVMFRVAGPDDYYRFSMDSERSYRRLVRVQNGVTTVLAEDGAGYLPGVWYEVGVRAEGPALEVTLDGAPILAAVDASHPAGRIALYSWGSVGARFDDVAVGSLGPPPVALLARTEGAGVQFDLLAPGWPGALYALGLSFDTAPGIPLALLDPTDPRVVPLVVDDLFLLSIEPFPLFLGFAGALDPAGAAAAWIALPVALPGLELFASGIVLHGPSPSGIGAVFPAVKVRFP